MIQQIKNKEYVFLLCQRISQPIGDLYTTSIPWSVIKKIAFTEPRILMGIDENGKEEYAGIQRLLSKERQKEIADYVNKDTSATFPSSIIINIPIDDLHVIPFSPTFSFSFPKSTEESATENNGLSDTEVNVPFNDIFIFVFPYQENVAQIIDGQHRMSGFQNSSSDLKFDLPVTIFVDQLVEKQADIFSTINGKQTRVTPSLVFDLFGLSQKRSPYKVANEVVKLLNESNSSPLKNWIRILGKANDFYSGYITQSTVVKNLLQLYSGNIKQAEEDKRMLAIGKKPSDIPALTSRETIFRDWFINEEDEIIYKTILNYFNAVKKVFSVEWAKEQTIIKKTVGFNALFKVFVVLAKKGKRNNNVTQEFFETELQKSADVNFEGILLSSKGINQLYDRFTLD